MIRDVPEVKTGLRHVYSWNIKSSEVVCVAGEKRVMDLSQNQNFPGLHCCLNTDLKFVENFTRPDFRAKNFTH